MNRYERTCRYQVRGSRRTSIRLVCELLESRELLSTFVVSNTSDGAVPVANSLRWAIDQVNADSTSDTIQFAIPGSGIQSIGLSSALPPIVNSVVIDGTSQPKYKGAPLIQLDGSALGPGSDGLILSAGQSTVKGLAVVGFSGSAIVVNAPGGDVIAANDLGVTAAGGQASANGTGITVNSSSSNTIGGPAGQANVISGNSGNGIVIQTGSSSADGTFILGNLIGTNPSGLGPIANGGAGIVVAGGSNTQIGLPGTGYGNVVSGNLGAGIVVSGTAAGTAMENNLVGIGVDGETPLGNGGDGILVDGASGTAIGGSDLNDSNIIGSNLQNGIETLAGSGAVLVTDNAIGTDVTGTLRLGNRQNGVQLASSSNTIGGSAGGASNTIDYNGSGLVGAGVQLVGSVNQNEILSNSMFGNAGLGINLGDGPTPNHAVGTPGPNNYQNYPVLTLTQSDGTTTTISGSLYSTPNTNFLLQFFSTPTADYTGYGQGKVQIGSDDVLTDSNGNVTFTVPIDAGSIPGQYVSATATDPSGNTSEFAQDVRVQGIANLSLTASGTPNPVAAGGELTYSLTVSNTGNQAAIGVMLADQLPSGVSFVSSSATQGYVFSSSGGLVTANLGTLPAGSSATLTILVVTSASTIGTLTDSASVSAQGNPAPPAESASVTTTVLASADLSVLLTASPNSVLAGGQLTDSITVANGGPQAASGVIVTLPLGSGVSLVSAEPSQGSVTTTGGQVVVNLGSLAASTEATVTVIVEPTVAGTLSQSATVTGTSLDPNPTNNTSTVTTQVVAASDLDVDVAASVGTAIFGEEFQYSVSVSDIGPSTATAVVLTNTLPAGVSFVSALAGSWGTPVYDTGVLTLSIASLTPGTTATMTINVTPTATPGTVITDSAAATAQQTDPNPASSSAILPIVIQGISDLSIAATAQPASVYVGQNVTYTISASNDGPDLEPDATLTCPIPAGASFVSASETTGGVASVANGLMTANVGPLAVGATADVSVVLTPLAAAAGMFSASFSIQGQSQDLNLSNNTVKPSVSVTPAADLALAISGGSVPPTVQADWTYTLTVANLGLSDATGVTAVSTLPPNVTFISATSSQGPAPVVQNGVISEALGGIAAGQAVTISVVVMPVSVGSIPLSASVSGAQFDPNLRNNQVTTSVSVFPSVNLNVLLDTTTPMVVAGQAMDFQATVSNTGPNPATNVVLSLPMGPNLVYDTSAASVGTSEWNAGTALFLLGTLNPGSQATVNVVATPQMPGAITQIASATSTERQLVPADATATATATVLESPGILQFSSPSYAVAETSGSAYLTVTRTGGSRGAVTVNYQTVPVNATPGLDFNSTSGTLSFAAGQTSAVIQVPVLADPWDDHNELVNVVLSSPGGGASIGAVSAAQLTIIDVDPKVTPVHVTQLSWTGSAQAITSVVLTFDSPLNPADATSASNYVMNAQSAGNPTITFSSINYSLANRTVTLVPSAPLASGVFYQLMVMGTGATGIHDLAGNPLAGTTNGAAGTNYVTTFGQGTKLQYVDNTGNQVTLKLTGPGYVEDVLDSTRKGVVLTVIGEVPRRTSLSGSLRKVRGSSGRTNLGAIRGLGKFGDVRVTLKSPTFLVNQYPFQLKGRGSL
jgi:uncharacterized repeat protein (TIGR01451 family)